MALNKFDENKYIEAIQFLGMVTVLFKNLQIGKEG